MKKLLLVTSTLLSIAVSENVLMENHSRSKRAWNSEDKLKKEKQVPQDDNLFDVENYANYARRISDTRFISEPMKFSSLAFIRQFDADKPKLNKPTVLISIGVQEATKTSGNSRLQENCSTRKNYRKYNQDWQLQQPFYVEEPKWVEIDSKYIDGSSGGRVDGGDPYILSRGKKIFRIKDPEQTNKIAQDYNEFPDYPSRLRLSTKSRVRRSIEVDGSDEKAHQDEERLDHNEIQVALDANKSSKRLAISKDVKFAEAAGKRKTYQVDLLDASPGKKIKNNKTTNMLKRIESKTHIIDKLGNLDTYENIRSRSKKPPENEMRTSNKDPIEKKPWEHDEEDKFDKTDEFDDNAETMDSRSASLIGKSEVSRALRMKDYPDRKKRSACENAACASPQSDDWRNIEKQNHDSSLKRRDKHHDILESLRLNEPYVISRGKKASNVEDHPYSALRLRSASPVAPSAARNLLRTLLLSMARSKCSNDNCDLNAFELTPDRQEFEPRDRRGTLDEILAGYDPFYVVRGKRADTENAIKVVSRFQQPL